MAKISKTTDEGAHQIARSLGIPQAPSPFHVTYSYRDTAPADDDSKSNTFGDLTKFQRLTPTQIQLMERAMDRWEEVANITFERKQNAGSEYSNDGTALIANYTWARTNSGGFADHKDDLWLNNDQDAGTTDGQPTNIKGWGDITSPALGSSVYAEIYIHELGHVLGLEHPGDYDSSKGSPTYSVATYREDSLPWTLMSYFDEKEVATAGEADIVWNAAPVTPMLHDIRAVQLLYGANYTTRADGTVYGFNSNTGLDEFTLTTSGPERVFAIWDGGGIDTIDMSGYSTRQIIDLREEQFSSTGNQKMNLAIAKGVVIEQAIGGSGADIIIGNGAHNVLDGRGGDDAMKGGLSNDDYYVDNVDDVVVEFADEGWNDRILSSASYRLPDNVETLDLISSSLALNAFGNLGVNSIWGNEYDNLIDGNWGGDYMAGEGGNDTYFVEDVADNVSELAWQGIDTVQASINYTLAPNVENLVLTAGAINGTGNELDNTIQGSGIGNVLNGGQGADILKGGLGDDSYILDSNHLWIPDPNVDSFYLLYDTVVEEVNAGTDTVYIKRLDYNSSYQLGENIENGVVIGTEAFDLHGNGLNNVLTGNAAANRLEGRDGNDTLDGAGGRDILVGGAGDDTYVLNGTSPVSIFSSSLLYDAVQEAANGGTDTIQVSRQIAGFGVEDTDYYTSYLLDANIENGVVIGTEAFDLYGNSLNNALTGNTAANRLEGRDGDDVLGGGLGADILGGGAGADQFVGALDELAGDTILDFSVEDTILVTGADLTSLDGSAVSGTIDLGSGWQLMLDGLAAAVGAFQAVLDGVNTLITWDTSINTDDPPVVANPILEQSVNEDTAWSFVVPAGTFTDADTPVLTYTATLEDGTALPPWLTFDATTQTFSGTPPQNFNGSIDLKVTGNDGIASASASFKLAVQPVNDAPVAADDHPEPAAEDTFVMGGVLANDGDVDAGPLTVLSVNGVAIGAGAVVNGTYGTLTIGADGSYTYATDKDAADVLTTGQQVTEAFTYLLSDSILTDDATLTFTVTGVDNEPQQPRQPQPEIFEIFAKNARVIISDFDTGIDVFHLEDSVFKGLGNSVLKNKNFASNDDGEATKNKAQIIYDTDDGRLLYDSDGTGSKKAAHFATLEGSANLSRFDFDFI